LPPAAAFRFCAARFDSGRPPFAAHLLSNEVNNSLALTLPVRSLVTPAIMLLFPASTDPSTMGAAELGFQLVHGCANSLRPRHLRHHEHSPAQAHCLVGQVRLICRELRLEPRQILQYAYIFRSDAKALTSLAAN
jgi:hypothetical protein